MFRGPGSNGRCARGPREGDEFAFGESRGRGGFGAHRGFYGRRHGGGRRPFDQGDLRLVVLGLIAEKPRHGYELIKEIEDRMGGQYAPSPGVIYPLLTMLEELGQIALSSSEGPKKLFAITPEGEAQLAEHKQTVDAIFARIAQFGEAFASHRPPQVMRAIENLRTALRLRTERGAITDDQAQAIAAAIDAAAQAIDRI
jgi:DNA-binding PadR family transcriptional regulator